MWRKFLFTAFRNTGEKSMMGFDNVKPEEIGEFDGAEHLMILASEQCVDELKESIAELKSPFFGAIFPEIFFRGKRYSDRVIVVRFDFKVDVFRGSELKETDGRTLMVFADGNFDGSEEILEKAFMKYGSVTYIGGGAGSLGKNIQCLFDTRGFFSKDCLFVSLPFEFNVKVRHGWRATELEFISTKIQGRRVVELDWRSAFDVYSEALESIGVEIDPENFFDVAKGYPFGLRRLEGEMVVKDPLAVERGVIVCAGRVPENCVLSLIHGDAKSLLSAARECADIEGENLIAFDCISRMLYLSEHYKQELKYLKDAAGAMTIGEIAAKKTYPDFYNKTVVVGGLD